MRFGVIGAMDEEIVQIRGSMANVSEKVVAGSVFYTGTLNGVTVVLVRCGIGKVNAALCAQILITTFQVNAVVNTGVAGAIDPRLNVGDIVLSSNVVHHDFDTTQFGDPYGFISRLNMTYFQADKALVSKAEEAAARVLPDVRVTVGTVASGDQFVSSVERKNFIRETFNAACTEMEGAAIGHVCALNDVPFVIIRAISDKADESATVNFEAFVRVAAENAALLVSALVG